MLLESPRNHNHYPPSLARSVTGGRFRWRLLYAQIRPAGLKHDVHFSEAKALDTLSS
jgi:hypothetical protein